VVIDPKETTLARGADIHLQLRPGTDGALALAMLQVITSVEHKRFSGPSGRGHTPGDYRESRYTRRRHLLEGSETEIATRMGYGKSFPWEAEEDAINFRLRSMDLTLDDLREMPGGYVYHQWRSKKYEQKGFKTPSGKVEIYSSELDRHGYAPLPVYQEPAESPVSAPRIAARYPLVLTTGARTLGYLHSRFRNVPSLLLIRHVSQIRPSLLPMGLD
jgi:anaerobic selenocysteine-containing dehydrogenase